MTNELILLYAMRYAFTDKSISPTVLKQEITRLWPELSEQLRETIQEETKMCIENKECGDTYTWLQVMELTK